MTFRRHRLCGRTTYRQLVFGVAFASLALCAAAQSLPSDPIAIANGLVTVSGDVSASFGQSDPGFFNYTDYERSALRMLRMDATASLRASRHLSLLGDLRSENASRPEVYALYLRVRPWATRRFDVQLGRVPPTFGAFARRNYAADNPLVGYPLAYQYLTSLRPDAIPASAAELLRMRGRGWLASYSVGNTTPDRGVPLATAFRWGTGVQVHAANDVVDVTASVTTGTLSNPRLGDDTDSPHQFAGRLALRPVAGLVVGVSASHGPFVSDKTARMAVGEGHDGEFTQTAWGGDVEYSRGYYLVRFETVFSEWTLPALGQPAIDGPVRALASSLEGRYKIRPGLYVAARADYLGFSTIAGPAGRQTWDAPLTRFEAGVGYSLQRNLLLKFSAQLNSRDGGRERTARLASGQLVFWF